MSATTSAPNAAGGDDAVVLEGVSKTFGQTVALAEVDLRVPKGQIVVLLGLSGSGKSTLLRHVDALHRPTSGTVTTLGTTVSSASGAQLRQVRRKVGFVFQQFHLVGSRTVLENVCTGALGRLRGPRLGLATYPAATRREALGHLERVGLADRAFQRADTLSGGQQQRVAIARALIQQPSVLLADEPVASLDPDSAWSVMDLLKTISREESLTVLCSLHQVELALGWGDRIVGLRAGRTVLDLPAAGLRADQVMPVYAREATTTASAGAVPTGADLREPSVVPA